MSEQALIGATIALSAEELSAGVISSDHLRTGALLLQCHGFVVLRGAIPPALAALMGEEFARTIDDCCGSLDGTSMDQIPWTSGGGSQFWLTGGRLRVFVRLRGPFAEPALVANRFAMAILTEVLGANFYCNSISSDTCLEGSAFQAPHRDIGFYTTGEIRGAIMNVPLTRCALDNGPLEIWPGGSHLWRRDLFARYEMRPFAQDVANSPVEALAARLPSLKVELEPGDLLLRDPGMLHRGTPNASGRPRAMLTIGYFRPDTVYEFGDMRYNLDDDQFEALAPDVRRLVEHRYRSGIGYPLKRG